MKDLKTRPGRAIVVFGGVETVQRLVAAGLVDEFWLKVNPVATGRGGAVFDQKRESHVCHRLR